ncbi:chymotrypsin-2-like [Venturia canescens]|uniref:chymotrypsin-2-like n=1 Tax=Venturia canescens TaxID=32260 RepID=UPI001C9CA31C|nr:chymotrypsin-2-like [Venturia canescens]
MQSVLGLLALVALCQGVPTALHGGRIVNGDDAKVGEFPFQVSLQTRYGEHFCGGSILNEYYVVTAAHCVVGERARDLQVVAGTLKLNEPRSIHYVDKYYVHEAYAPRHSWSNDIALIKVSVPFRYSSTVKFVPLPENHAKVKVGSVAVVSGWGTLMLDGPTPDRLQRTDVMIVSQEYCNKTNSEKRLPVYDNHVCALSPDVITGPCHGDSGGPLTVDGQLVGVTSWVITCASTKYPTVYTRVSEYVDWLHEHAV